METSAPASVAQPAKPANVLPVGAKMAVDAAILAGASACCLAVALTASAHRWWCLAVFGVGMLVSTAIYRWVFRETAVPERFAARAQPLPVDARHASLGAYTVRWIAGIGLVITPFVIALATLPILSDSSGAMVAAMFAGIAVTKTVGALRQRRHLHRTGLAMLVRSDRRTLTEGDYYVSP